MLGYVYRVLCVCVARKLSRLGSESEREGESNYYGDYKEN